MRIFKIKDRMYQKNIRLIVGCSQKTLFDLLKKHYDVVLDSDSANGTYFKIERDSKEVHIIWVESFEWYIWEQSMLLHEIYHLVNAVMREIGMKLSEDSEEAYAYYLQSLMNEMFDKLTVYHPKKQKCN